MPRTSTSTAQGRPGEGNRTLKEWLDCGTAFCELITTLDREGVNQAAWNGHKVPNGLHWDGKQYLRASGVTAERFSRTAGEFVRRMYSKLLAYLTFSVEAGEPIVDGTLATLRIQHMDVAGRQHPAQVQFSPIGLGQRPCEPLLFGTEARIQLCVDVTNQTEKAARYQMTPCVRLTYEVTGQNALKLFASVLRDGQLQRIWEDVGGFDVETNILLTRDNSQDSIEEQWVTSDDREGKRMLKFCTKASKLSTEETCDWPPYLRLSRTLKASNTEGELERYFFAISAHASCIVGESGGWYELLEDFKRRDTHQ